MVSLNAHSTRRIVMASGVCLVLAGAAGAQQVDAQAVEAQVGGSRIDVEEVSGVSIDGPPPPVAPAVVSRDRDGRVTLRAVRLPEGLVIDGRLDESVYQDVLAVSDFIQQEPREGEPATEKTDAWIFFDDNNLYVSARNWDSQPERIVANEMRRDNRGIDQNETFVVVLDTFYDRRNGFFFQTNPLGAVRDGLVTDERQNNTDWNTVWDVSTARFDQGWTVEMAIPFKSLRYKEGRSQIWGINLRRKVRWKNETSYLSPIPASYSLGGVYRFSSAATLVGVEIPRNVTNLEFKPYAISSLTTDRDANPSFSNELAGDVGFDGKYGLTQGLTADFTVNTDFAQVEDDEAQVNLTRFSLFFPEKREFFLEGQGIFSFGGSSGRRGGGSTLRRLFGRDGATPTIFFSRRIGLDAPIRAGGRITGRAGRYTLGLLNIQTGEELDVDALATNFSVVRIRRDILRRSDIGIIGTHRSINLDGDGSNQAFGADANFSFFQNLNINAYYARTQSPGRVGDQASYRGRMQNNGDRYGFTYEHLVVGEDFNPEVGFLRRRNFRRNFGQVRFTPRPRSIRSIRKFTYQAQINYITNATDGTLETRELQGLFQIEFESSDRLFLNATDTYEFLPEPFEISDGVVLPEGGYDFREVQVFFNIGRQRRINGFLSAGTGSFFSGNRTNVGYRGRVEVNSQLSIEPSISLNFVDLPEGRFTTRLLRTRVTYTLSPRSFLGALLQYNSSSDSISTNIRYRWEYEPGSDLFIVYSEGRGTDVRGFPLLQNRGLVIKFTKLLRL